MNKSVMVGKDEYLFLIGGNHKVLEYFTNKIIPTEQSIETFWSNIKKRATFCRERGIEYKHFIFPDKLYALRMKTNLSIKSLYITNYEVKNKISEVIYFDFPINEVENFYHKTDTHLNVFGSAYCIKQMVGNVSNEILKEFNLFIENNKKKEKIIGDLGKKLEPAISEIIVSRPLPPSTFRYSNSIVGGNNGMLDIYVNHNAIKDKRVLVFGDSFFRISLGLLSYFYKEIIFCRTPFFYPEIVSSCSPDIVFSGNAERYLSNVNSDELRKNFFLLPLLDEKQIKPTKGFGDIFKNIFNLEKL